MIEDPTWRQRGRKPRRRDLKISQGEGSFFDTQHPKGEGHAWSGSHSGSVLALFSFSCMENTIWVSISRLEKREVVMESRENRAKARNQPLVRDLIVLA